MTGGVFAGGGGLPPAAAVTAIAKAGSDTVAAPSLTLITMFVKEPV